MSLILLNKNFVPTEPAVVANTRGKSVNQQANSEAQLRPESSAYLNRRKRRRSRKQLGLLQGLEQPPEALKKEDASALCCLKPVCRMGAGLEAQLQ